MTSLYDDLFSTNYEFNELLPLNSLNSYPERPEKLADAPARDESKPTPSAEGQRLIEPYLPVVKAAHQNELPSQVLTICGKEHDMADYICALAAGIWYGIGLDDPRLPDRLENLRRFQEWYDQSRYLIEGQTVRNSDSLTQGKEH